MKLVLETDKPVTRMRTETVELLNTVAECPPGGSYGGLTEKEATKVASAIRKVHGYGQSVKAKELDGTWRVGRKILGPKPTAKIQEALVEAEKQ